MSSSIKPTQKKMESSFGRLFDDTIPISTALILRSIEEELHADSIALYLFDSNKNQWETFWKTGKWSEFSTPYEKKELANILFSFTQFPESRLWSSASKDRELKPFAKREGIISVAGIPLIYDEELIGLLLINFRTHQKFTEASINSFIPIANQLAESLVVVQNTMKADLISPNVLRVQIPLASLLSIKEFFNNVTGKLLALEFVYLIYAITYSANTDIVKNLISRAQSSSKTIPISKAHLDQIIKHSDIKPLQLVSIHYGSPGSFDLLGIGKILEILRDTIKELMWLGKHEKQIAHEELRHKQADAEKVQLEVNEIKSSASWRSKHEEEMATLELQGKKAEIQKIMIENENAVIDLFNKKLDTLDKLNSLKIKKEDRQVLASILMPYATTISTNLKMPLLLNGAKSTSTKNMRKRRTK